MPTTDHNHHLLDLDIPIFRPIEGVFSDLNLSEILYSLEGKGEIPSKYVYFGNGVQNWENLSISNKEDLVKSNYSGVGNSNVGKSYELMNDNLDLILGAFSDKNCVNVVDIGTGTGYPVYPILSFLQEKKKLNKYIAIDIVEEMCDLAIDNLTSIEMLSKMKTQKYVHDFEYGHFADLMFEEREEDSVNLFVFIGSTLGNMVDRHRALANIRDNMTIGDKLWIGNTLINNMTYIENFYNNMDLNSPDYDFYLGHILCFFDTFRMNHKEFGQIKVRPAEDNGMLKYYFQVNKSFELEVVKKKAPKNNIIFRKGDEIVVCRLKNYAEYDLIEELKEAGLKPEMINISKDSRSALALTSLY